jgi:hypothetical protein
MTLGTGAGNTRLYCYIGATDTAYVVLVVGAGDITIDADTAFDGDTQLPSAFKVNVAVYGANT